MAYNFGAFKKRLAEVDLWLKEELVGIQTGRATPTILDRVFVESYGTKMPVKQVASVTTEDARTLRVSPWDRTQLKALEKGIGEANLGLSVVADDKGLRVIFPELTAERRTALSRLIKQKFEEARVSLRSIRDEVWHEIQEEERAGRMAEDDKFRAKEEMEKITKEANDSLEEIVDRKEKDIAA